MANGQFGGRISFEFAGIRIPPTEADIMVDPTVLAWEAKANQDGSGCYTAKPKLAKFEFKLRNAGEIDWQALVNQTGNCTIVEETTGRVHLLTACMLIGEPKLNLSTGEVDGLSAQGPNYRALPPA